MRSVVFVLAASAVLAACGGKAGAPCGQSDASACPNIAGTYHLVTPTTDPAASSCGEIYWTGGEADVTVTQTGSVIGIPEFFNVTGTLYSDLSADFNSVDVRLDTGEPGTLKTTGHFGGSEGSYTFNGYLSIAAQYGSSGSCTLSVTATMTELK
jgi:hypothetical protein